MHPITFEITGPNWQITKKNFEKVQNKHGLDAIGSVFLALFFGSISYFLDPRLKIPKIISLVLGVRYLISANDSFCLYQEMKAKNTDQNMRQLFENFKKFTQKQKEDYFRDNFYSKTTLARFEKIKVK